MAYWARGKSLLERGLSSKTLTRRQDLSPSRSMAYWARGLELLGKRKKTSQQEGLSSSQVGH
jgi:hypothetical protein